jgi:hypothetical protein
MRLGFSVNRMRSVLLVALLKCKRGTIGASKRRPGWKARLRTKRIQKNVRVTGVASLKTGRSGLIRSSREKRQNLA